MELFDNKNSGAIISDDRKHRYSLWRFWDDKPKVLFIGVNPSRADAVRTDNTISKCINFTKKWGFGGLYFANLFSFRTPYVYRRQLETASIIPGDEKWEPLVENLNHACNEITDMYLQQMIHDSAIVVCAWGSWPFIEDRAKKVLEMIDEPTCFGINQDGHPKHPLYLKSSTDIIPYAKANR